MNKLLAGVVLSIPDTTTWTERRILPNLRWRDGILQQLNLVEHKGPGLSVRQVYEWVAVPTVPKEASDSY